MHWARSFVSSHPVRLPARAQLSLPSYSRRSPFLPAPISSFPFQRAEREWNLLYFLAPLPSTRFLSLQMDATPAAAAESSGRRGSDEGGKGRSGGQRNRKAASSLELLPSSSPSLLSSSWPAPLISSSALCTRFNVSVLDPSVVHVAASEILFSIGIFVRTRS